MNFSELRPYFAKLNHHHRGPDGVVALPRIGESERHAREIAAAHLAQLPAAERPKNVVFWHSEAHAQAFDAKGEFVGRLRMAWSGDRARITALLRERFREAPVVVRAPTTDEAPFEIEPPAPPPPASDDAPFEASEIGTTKLKDTAENERRLVATLVHGDDRAVLAALRVLHEFGMKREDKAYAAAKKAGTLETHLADDKGSRRFPDAALAALDPKNIAAAARAFGKDQRSEFLIALVEACEVGHPRLAELLDAALAAKSMWPRVAVARLGQYRNVRREVVEPRLWRLVIEGDPETAVVSEAVKSLSKMTDTSIASIWIDLLLERRLAPAQRTYAFDDIPTYALTDEERAQARPIADWPEFADHTGLADFRRATAPAEPSRR